MGNVEMANTIKFMSKNFKNMKMGFKFPKEETDHRHGCLVTWLQTIKLNTIRRKWQRRKNPIAHSYNFMYMFLKVCPELLALVC